MGESRGENAIIKMSVERKTTTVRFYFMEHLIFVSKNIHLIRLENRENQKKWAKRNTNCVVARLVGMGFSVATCQSATHMPMKRKMQLFARASE